MTTRHVLAMAVIAFAPGCAAATKTGAVALGATAWLAGAIVQGILDDDETIVERDRRERRERQWKQVWRDNPDINPAMTEAFKNEY